MKKSYLQPNIFCYTINIEECIAASDPLHPTVSITDENVDTSSKSRRQDIWDDEDENND